MDMKLIEQEKENHRKAREALKFISSILIDNGIWFECNSADNKFRLPDDVYISADEKYVIVEYIDLDSRQLTEYCWYTEDELWKEHIADVIIQALEENK